ncbi:cleavage and polyadenylation specificity factor subunit 1-like [Watersipora subatra]|uniref:cleavage and polyadenylation specificity factor subunit 1-like n=1 Tax=Watersipora subatra TaxID=2589382 RepID=UPI00355AE797
MSSSIYGLVKTVHQPVAVDACCSCQFLSNKEEDLVIASGNWLKVYRVVSDDMTTTDSTILATSRHKLEHIMSYHMFGNIISVKSLRLPWNCRDILLLSFKDAKISVVEYDPHTRDIVTLSLHYFEEDELKSGLYSNFKKPVLRVDPDLRCAAMLVYGCQLVVLPLKKDVAVDDPSSSKSPFAPSYIISLSKMEEKIHNIVDVQFLQGYYEPTLFILYEPIKTWAGRLPVRRDTCKIAAISLNLLEKVHPVIWSLDNLPFDCQKSLAIPKPIGGVLVLAATSVIYLNQSVPPYAASVTSLSNNATVFPMKPQESIVLTLDNAHCCSISSDQVVISTKAGEIYVMTLCLDSMRAVKKFHFDKAASSVLPSCICTVGDGIIFLGSRLGNSLLLKYTPTDTDTKAVPVRSQGEAIEKDQAQPSQDWLAKDAVELENELEELEVYGNTEAPSSEDKIIQYTFQVSDSLINIAPCGRITLGEPAFLSEELAPLCQVDLDLELVTTSGYGKNGALTFLQRSVRPQIVTTFQLADVRAVWTVKGPLNAEDVEESQRESLDTDMHSYLILGKEDSTMVLQTTDDISELDHSGFNTQTYTVFAGNIGECYTVQVTAKGIRLLYGVTQLQNIPVEIGSSITHASLCDPYLMVVSELGAVMLLQLKESEGSDARLTVLKQPGDLEHMVANTACLYRDVSGMFTFPDVSTSSQDTAKPPATLPRTTRLSSSIMEEKAGDISQEEVDEDELLYGDSEMNISQPEPTLKTGTDEQHRETPANRVANVILRKEHEPTFWVFTTTRDNTLQIFSIPDCKLVFSAKQFNSGYKVLFDADCESTNKQGEPKSLPTAMSSIEELLVTALGQKKHKVYLFARTTNSMLLVYEAFPYTEQTHAEKLQLRFRRFTHNLILRERRRVARKRQADGAEVEPKLYAKQLLHPFENIGGYTGVFIAGPYPHWFILSSKGELRCHPMGIDNGIVCMANFHNINCPRGFLYFNKQDELRISILPAHLTYDQQWPSRKVPLKTTAHFVRYDPETKVYVVVCSTPEPCKKLVKIENDEKQFLELERDERFVYPMQDRYYIQLLSPINCDFIPGTRVDLGEGQSITSAEILSLAMDGQQLTKNFIGLATNNSFNEEVTAKGQIMLYDIIEVVPEPGQPLTKNKLKEIYCKEQKGPVTSLTHVEGMLVAAIGQKVYVFEVKDNDLLGASFIDSHLYIHQMVSVKNLVLIADIQMSISILRYQVEHRVLSIVSRDMKPQEVYAVEFAVDNTNLGFVATDREQNLSIYMYQPDSVHSSGGTILMKKADINLGACVNSLCRVRCKLNDPTTSRQFSSAIEKRHVTYFATVDGGVGYMLPLTERVYRRLDMTQKLLYTSIQHTASLNPKTFRSVRTQNKLLQNSQHNLIDGDLVWKYLGLTHDEQTTLAKRMGTTPDQIIEDLLEIDRITTHF